MNDINKYVLQNYFNIQKGIKNIPSDFHNEKERKELIFKFNNSNIFEIDVSLDKLDSTIKIIMEKDLGEIDLFSLNLENLNLPSPYTFIADSSNKEFIRYMNHVSGLETNIEAVTRQYGYLITRNEIVQFFGIKIYNSYNHPSSLQMGTLWSTNPKYLNLLKTHGTSPNSQHIYNLKYAICCIMLIDSFQKINIDLRTKKSQFDINSITKHKKVEKPKSYYRVQLRAGTSIQEDKEIEDKLKIVREKTFAYFVRAHYKVRIIKGSLPLTEREEKFLKKDSRRRIFTSKDQVDSENSKILQRRQIQWNENEWISILEYRVCGHIANSKNGQNPYVPSFHVVPK